MYAARYSSVDDPNAITWSPDITQHQYSSYYEDIDESVNAVIAMIATSLDGPKIIEEALSGPEKEHWKMNIDYLKKIRLGV